MDLNKLFHFTKTRESLEVLEKLLVCEQCNEYCSNPRRHADCGNLLCACNSAEYGTCPYCKQRFSPSNTSPDWHMKSIIEATKQIMDLVCPKKTNEDRTNDKTVDVNSKKDDEKVKTPNDNVFEENSVGHIKPKVSFNSLPEDRKLKEIVRSNSKTSGGFSKPTKKEGFTSNTNDLKIVEVIHNANTKSQIKRNSKRETKLQTACVKDDSMKEKKVPSDGAVPCTKDYTVHISKSTKKNELFTSDVNNLKVVEVVNTANIKPLMKRNAKGETKLHTACVKGDTMKVKEFLSAGADPCTKDYAGWTPLHEAVSKGNLDMVKLLLEAGAMVNVPGGYNNTPLHDAAVGNHVDIACLLMTYGADPELKNIEGFTPKYMAQTEEMSSILNNNYDIVPTKMRKNVYQPDIVLFNCNLPVKDRECLNNVLKHFKLKQVSSYNASVTHLVVSAKNSQYIPTMDILSGLLKGKWIIDSQWLKLCLETTKIIDPSQFEVTGTKTFPDSNAPKRSRLNAEKMQPSLFNGCHVYFSGVDKVIHNDIKFTKAQLSSLVTTGDGVVLSREPNPEAIPAPERTVPYHGSDGAFEKCSHFIIYQSGRNEPALKYNMSHVKSLPVSWLLNCIETFELIEP